jgi:selenocysteine lyase/cysteine desulfurase
VLYGKYDLLDSLRAYKVRPAEDQPPGKFETGTQNHEGQAGTLGAIEYFEWLGEMAKATGSRRAKLTAAMTMLAWYERGLCGVLIVNLQTIPGLKIWGITDPKRMDQRVPTVSFTLAGWHPRRLAERLAAENIYVWDGNYYALAVMERLGLQSQGGAVRVGLAHYNTVEEVMRLIELLKDLAASGGPDA